MQNLPVASYYTQVKFRSFPQAHSVQSLSHVQLFVTPWIAARQASLSITNSRSSLRLMSIESVMPSSHLILCRPLLLLPPIPPSIRAFSNESTLRVRWPKYWSFSFSIIPSKEIPGLISFRMDWPYIIWYCLSTVLIAFSLPQLISPPDMPAHSLFPKCSKPTSAPSTWNVFPSGLPRTSCFLSSGRHCPCPVHTVPLSCSIYYRSYTCLLDWFVTSVHFPWEKILVWLFTDEP